MTVGSSPSCLRTRSTDSSSPSLIRESLDSANSFERSPHNLACRSGWFAKQKGACCSYLDVSMSSAASSRAASDTSGTGIDAGSIFALFKLCLLDSNLHYYVLLISKSACGQLFRCITSGGGDKAPWGISSWSKCSVTA